MGENVRWHLLILASFDRSPIRDNAPAAGSRTMTRSTTARLAGLSAIIAGLMLLQPGGSGIRFGGATAWAHGGGGGGGGDHDGGGGASGHDGRGDADRGGERGQVTDPDHHTSGSDGPTRHDS